MIFLGIQLLSLMGILYFELSGFTAVLFSLLFGFGTSSHMLTYTIGKNAVPAQYSGSAISIVNAAMFFIGGVFAAVIGFFLERTGLHLHDYQTVALIFWLGMSVAFVAVLFFKDSDERMCG